MDKQVLPKRHMVKERTRVAEKTCGLWNLILNGGRSHTVNHITRYE